MAAAILVFFWALDRVRKERVRATLEPEPRATPRELVERLLKPAAENLSLRRRVQGKPTLGEDLARAGLNITGPEYLLIRIGAVALGALIGLFRFGFSFGPVPARTRIQNGTGRSMRRGRPRRCGSSGTRARRC